MLPGSGRSPGEGIGHPLQYSWASLVAQLVKNLLQCERPGLGRSPGEGKGYPLQYSGLESSMDCTGHGGRKKLDTTERLSLAHSGDISCQVNLCSQKMEADSGCLGHPGF